MDPLTVAVMKAAGIVGGLALFVYVLCRIVSSTKKAGRAIIGGETTLGLLMFLGSVIAPTPPREATAESRAQKRDQDQDESGDPENPASAEPAERAGRKLQ